MMEYSINFFIQSTFGILIAYFAGNHSAIALFIKSQETPLKTQPKLK